MGEINSFPIGTKSFDDLDSIQGEDVSSSDKYLIYDESQGLVKAIDVSETRKYAPFIYETVAQLVSSDIPADTVNPFYVKVEETGYRLYKIINTAPEAGDILLDNGNVAVLQEEYQLAGFVQGPADSSNNAVAVFDGEDSYKIKPGPIIGDIGESLIAADTVSDTSFIKINPDSSVVMRNTAQMQDDLGIDERVVGPASSANEQIALFDGASGKLLKAGQTLAQYFSSYLDAFLVTLYNIFPRTVNAYADFATTPALIGRVFYLKQHTSGDVGGDFFVGISSAGLTPDSGLISSSATPGVFFKRINFSFVTPEMFGAGLSTSPSDDAPTRAALLHPLPCRLSRVYSLSSQVTLPANKKVFGNGKATTGLIASAGFSIPGAASSVLAIQSFCNLQNFTVDANDQDGGGGKRLNCVPTTADAKGFFVSNVDVKNSTGYGHVTFGSESDPQVTGYYENCHGYNCQVPFEQIGALDVTLVKCTAEGVAGRTLELFHPYGGSKNVTYISCRAWGESGAGINILTTNGHPVGPIRFIDSSIDVSGAVSAVNVEKATGADTTVDLQIIGGSYKSALGSALNLNTNGKFKFLAGAKFQGGEACNMPPFAAQVEFNGAEVLTAKASNTQQSIALVVNSAEVKVVGGRVEATNSGSGGSLAIMGLANVSEQTSLIPPVGGNIVFVAHSAGVTNLQADGANGFVNISVPINTSDVNKIILSYSVVNTSDAYPASNSSSWFLLDPANIRIRFLGINDPSMKISYDIKIIQ